MKFWSHVHYVLYENKRLIWGCLSLFFLLVVLPFTFVTAQQAQTPTGVYRIAWSPVKSHIAFTDFSNTTHVWDATNSHHLWMTGHLDYISTLRWNPNGTLLAVNSYAGKNVNVWDATTGDMLTTIEEETGSLGLDWTPDGTRILTSTDGIDDTSVLRQWDVITGDLLESNAISATQIYRSPDGRTLALAQPSSLELRDAATLELIANLSKATDYAQGYQVTTATWSPDGRFLAGGYLNGMVRVWDVNTLEIDKEFRANEQVFENRGVPLSTVRGVAFDVSGTLFWSISADGTLRQWDISDGMLTVDQQVGKVVFAAAWSSYRAQLAVGVISDEQQSIASDLTDYDLLSSLGLQIVVPTASIEQIHTIAQNCMSNQHRQELGIDSLTSSELPNLIIKLQALPVSLKSTACFADVLALADTLTAEDK